MDDKDLKIEALKERLGQITINYEETIADLRVRLHRLAEQNEKLTKEAVAGE